MIFLESHTMQQDGSDSDSEIDGDTNEDGLTDHYELDDVTAGRLSAATLNPNPATGTNKGIEGITYDESGDRYFVVREAESEGWLDLDNANGDEIVYEVSRSGVTTPIHIPGLVAELDNRDASDIHYADGHLFILTQFGVDQVSRATYNSSTASWEFNASDANDVLADIPGTTAEGLTFTHDGLNLFILNESRLLVHYRNFTSYEPASPVLVGSSVDTSVDIRITAPEGSYIAVFEDDETTPIATHKLDYGDTSHVFSLTGLDPGWQEITYKLSTDSSSTSDKFSPASEPLPRVDFNSDDQLDADDIDILFAAIDLEWRSEWRWFRELQ